MFDRKNCVNVGKRKMKSMFPPRTREETQGDKFLNLASSAGLPAAFPPDAADFANYHGTAGLCTQNVQQNLQCGSSALENPPGDLSKLQIFYGMVEGMVW